MNTVSTLGYPADLYLTVSAKKSDGTTVTLSLPPSQRRVQPGAGTITFVGSEVGQFLSKFGDAMPDSLYLRGSVLVNPDYATGYVSSASSVGGSVDLAIPLTIGISSATYRDTVAFATNDNGSSSRPGSDQLVKVNGAKLHFEIENGLPVGVSLNVRLLDKLHNVILTLPQSGQPFQMTPSFVDADGYSAAPGLSTFVIDLNHAEAQQYIPAEFVDYDVQLATSGSGSVVNFRTTDQIKVRMWTQCSYEVKK
jgi:hypothetical protein